MMRASPVRIKPRKVSKKLAIWKKVFSFPISFFLA
jgi:hypothetical protein